MQCVRRLYFHIWHVSLIVIRWLTEVLGKISLFIVPCDIRATSYNAWQTWVLLKGPTLCVESTSSIVQRNVSLDMCPHLDCVSNPWPADYLTTRICPICQTNQCNELSTCLPSPHHSRYLPLHKMSLQLR